MLSFGLSFFGVNTFAQKTATTSAKKDPLNSESTFSAFRFRSIGPAVTSGRVGDIAVNPKNKSEYYVVASSGGIFKTTNNGASFEPIFEDQTSYSVGCITIDPNNPNILWVGSGENNNQRSVAYGDGVYKSEDGGKTWKNVGLTKSERIGRISIDPNNSDIVYVAAYGPLWNAGGERGIYKTTDGGKTWKQVLNISENTGCNDVLIHPKNSNILYAAAHQRRRHEWTYISGGPESAFYRSLDGGATWSKVTNGLPSGELGRIGLAISPANNEILYAIVEGEGENKGFYRSTDRGASFEKRSGWSTAGNYYQEIVADPCNQDKVYSLDTWAMVSSDGGKSFHKLGEKNKHVDNHALYVEPENTNHLLMGCDGGLYESYDGAKSWSFKANLPITQFYRVCTDNALPFYNVYGGTQDNNSMGGPSRTLSASGIVNADWFITVGGDGFESQVDPTDPNIVYSQWQYGGLIRYDRKSGEIIDIKPQELNGEAALRWNWDAPLLISKFDNKRLYFCANKVFKSDDRGQSWQLISGDLSRNLDRNKLPVMGKVWSMDAVAKNQSTSIYGNITAFAESPKNEKLLFAGTDDGLIQITDNGGSSWTKIEKFAGIPERTRVQNIVCSQHDENVVYAIFNNHRSGDFKPYVLKSSDKGKTWASINGNLPERGSSYCLVEDHINKNLLFVGTEFGVFVSLNGGASYTQMKNGLPTICVPDMEIQKRENDLVIATFGRGFYILDDYSPLQNMKSGDFDAAANIFPVKDGIIYNPSVPLGHKGKSFQGIGFYNAENPAIGANITYYLKDDYKSLKEIRKEKEKEAIKAGKNVYYPSADSIRMEDTEEAPYTVMMISDSKNKVIRKLKLDANKGLHRVTWDGRYSKPGPVTFYSPDPDDPYQSDELGHLALPGTYKAQLFLVKNGKTEKLSEAVSFNIKPAVTPSIKSDAEAMMAYYEKIELLKNDVGATANYLGALNEKIKNIKQALIQSNTNTDALLADLLKIETSLKPVNIEFYGDGSMAKREFETLPGIGGIIDNIIGGLYTYSGGPTGTYEKAYETAQARFRIAYNGVRTAKNEMEILEKKLDEAGIVNTPGRFPEYNKK